MNFVKDSVLIAHRAKTGLVLLTASVFLFAAGCGDHVRLPSKKDLAEFEKAGPLCPSEDANEPQSNAAGIVLYHVQPGDVLEVTMPAMFQVTTVEASESNGRLSPYMYRLSDRGTIMLPVAGELEVEGKTLGQVETAISEAYYPKYTDVRPAIFAKLIEKKNQPLFSVLGLVNKPGNFPYPPDTRYNLMHAIGFAEGLDRTAEPRYATIYRLKSDGNIASVVLQVVNTGKRLKLTDAMNMCIKPGDIVDVEQTPRTRTNEFLKGLFRINVGAYAGLDNILNNSRN